MPATVEMHLLDLADWSRDPQARVLAGRDSGERVRAAAKLDELDRASEVVQVRIPLKLFAVTSSFFLGMFGASIRYLGEAKFRQHYQFTGKPITRVIEDGIRSVLLTDPLS
jgi:hypothetical protein